MKKYVLNSQNEVVEATSLNEWAVFFEDIERRRVGDDTCDEVRVSTVFLGMDHQFGDGPPLLFETMVFGGVSDQVAVRCSTWEEALKAHEKVCKEVFDEQT